MHRKRHVGTLCISSCPVLTEWRCRMAATHTTQSHEDMEGVTAAGRPRPRTHHHTSLKMGGGQASLNNPRPTITQLFILLSIRITSPDELEHRIKNETETKTWRRVKFRSAWPECGRNSNWGCTKMLTLHQQQATARSPPWTGVSCFELGSSAGRWRIRLLNLPVAWSQEVP
jgi:hypothetical protein